MVLPSSGWYDLLGESICLTEIRNAYHLETFVEERKKLYYEVGRYLGRNIVISKLLFQNLCDLF